MKRIILILFILPLVAQAQRDTEFWFSAPDINDLPMLDRPILLRVSSYSNPATINVSLPANPSFAPLVIGLAANSATTIDLTPWIALIENSTPNAVLTNGILITSSSEISVYYEVVSANPSCSSCNPELFSLKGKNALGTEFMIPSETTWGIDTIRYPNARASFDIVATENNTVLNITPSKPLIGRNANVQFSVTLNRGETFSNQGLYRNSLNLLNGSTVTASKPIAITTREDLLFADGPCADLAGDQLIPVSIFGTDFVVIRGNLFNRDRIVVTAALDNTDIYLDGASTPVATINRGTSYEYDLISQPTSYIQTSNKVSVLHYSGMNCEISSAVIPKLSCTGSTDVSIVKSADETAFLLVVTRNGNQGNFTVNGNPGILTAADFLPVTGTAGAFVFCKKDVGASIPLNAPTRIVNSSGKFQLGFLNGASPTMTTGCRYGYFSDFKSSNVEVSQIEICKTDSAQLSAFGGVTYQWSPALGLSSTVIPNPKASPGVTTVYKVIITSADGCIDSAFTTVNIKVPDLDFAYTINNCAPLEINFTTLGTPAGTIAYDFGDGGTSNAVPNPVHVYNTQGDYLITYSVENGACRDTIRKTISLNVINENIILTTDTTICAGSVIQLRTIPSLDFCWSPTTYLDDPNLPQPKTSTPQDITYYFTAQVASDNVIVNGDFSQGDVGFITQYTSAAINNNEGQYLVGTNPQAWNGGMSPCTDHTSGGGKMMMVNGSPALDLVVWKQTVTVTPNTNYAFSTWIESFSVANPAQLQFSINGNTIGPLISATLPTCSWAPFYATWNSGNNTSAVISIINKNTLAAGNDFGLDDISFAPVIIKRDSVKITVETPVVTTIPDAIVCKGSPLQLTTTGAQTYTWSPAGGLSDPSIASPIATPAVPTEYHVAGTTANGCVGKDTVFVDVYPVPTITKSNDTTICKNASVQLFVNGGVSYSWAADPGLSNLTVNNPVATPTGLTTYFVTVTDGNNCNYKDSVKVDIHPDPVFAVNTPLQICVQDSITLQASGGTDYVWQPSGGLSNAAIANPKASPAVTTDYTVLITETTCNNAASLSTRVTVKALPSVNASKSNDLDCSTDNSKLLATGASNYLWTPSATLNNAAIPNPIAHPVVSTEYIVTGTDGSGCSNKDTVLVEVKAINEGQYQMPNAFTPDGDGINDCFGIGYWGIIENVEFSIYNRWGQLIFFTRDPHGCWDGTYKGVKQAPDVFVYMIKAKTACAPSVFRKGTFVLIR